MEVNRLTNKELIGAFEAIIFASGEPVAMDKIALALQISMSDVSYVVSLLEKKYAVKESGIRLLRLNDSLQFCSNSDYITQVRAVLDLKKNSPLSQASMEVLSLIAYNQPVTKAFIEQVRGVDCSGVVSTLVQRELVEEKGRLELPGKPLLYGVTENFLRCFGLSTLEDLPPIPEDEPKKETEEPIQLKLGET